MSVKLKVKKWISNRAEECKSVAPLYSYALDRKLTLLERFRIRFHLMTCNACTSYVSNINFLSVMAHSTDSKIDDERIQLTLSPDAKDRIKSKLKDGKSVDGSRKTVD